MNEKPNLDSGQTGFSGQSQLLMCKKREVADSWCRTYL